ncbi:MAG TPA: hypothetical protein VHS96_11135, partial [Bacteroidia bacterium]|nr:hypothetical protein [Bacteroidia bacterium]
MIDIKVAGQSLDLMPNTSIQIEWVNPLWDMETIPGVRSFPFTLNDTDRNRNLLQYTKVLMRQGGGISRVDAEIHLGGLPFLAGKLYIQRFTDRNYTVYFSSQSGDVAAAIEGVGLRDLEMGGPRIMGPDSTTWRATMLATTTAGNWPAQDFVFFPIRNYSIGLDDESISLAAQGVSGYDGITTICPIQNFYYNGAFHENWFYDLGMTFGWDLVWTIPFVYVGHILEQAFEVAGYSISGSWLQDPEIASLVINSLKVHHYWTVYVPVGGFAIDLASGMPDISIAEFLIGLRKMFCLAFIFDSVSKSVEIAPIREILRSSEVEDWTSLATPTFEANDQEPPTYEFSFDIDSEDAKSEQVSDLRNLTEGDPVADQSMLPALDVPATYRFIQDEFAYWSVDKEGTTWKFTSFPLNPYGNKNASQGIKTKLSPVLSWRGNDTLPTDFNWIVPPPIGRFWKLPAIEQFGSFNITGVKEAAFAARLMFYRGMVADNNGNTYPFGSADNYDWAGNRIAEYSLHWGGEDGLYNQWWSEWIVF